MSALRTIMKEIETVLVDNQDFHGEDIDDKTLEEINQLALEGKLVREVNEELDVDEGVMYGDVDVEGRSLDIKEKQMPRKRLSDVSVQTVNLAEDNDIDVPDCLSDRGVGQPQFLTQSKYCHLPSDRPFDSNREVLDPAIIDFHLSPVKEIEKLEKRREMNKDDPISTNQATNIVQDLFLKMKLEGNGVVNGNLERSNSRDSSLSDDGIIDDSGVESDCFGGIKVGRSLDSKVNDSYRGMDVRSRRTLHGCVSEPSLKLFDLDQYLMKSKLLIL